MSGHSKWSTIKRKKGKSDEARGKVFTKIGREIAVAVKAGGADVDSNSRLRDLVAKAKSANMPNDNIARSIKKASGELNSINYEEVIYEGYGINGVAVIVETLTDNKNRTAGEVRHAFDKNGGSMGTTGCVSYLFETKGIILIKKPKDKSEDDIMMIALDCGADDFAVDGDECEIITTPADFSEVREKIEKSGFDILNAEIQRIPANMIEVEEDNVDKFMRMLDMFDDNDDVQNVFHNANIEDEEDDE